MAISISVVVCKRNRVDSLRRRCVQALAYIHTDYEWKLVIVDNVSDEGTNPFLASLPSQYGKAHVITAFEPKRGLARYEKQRLLSNTREHCCVYRRRLLRVRRLY
jgi:hypothetical protein